MLKIIAIFLTCIFIGLAGFSAESHHPEKAEEWIPDFEMVSIGFEHWGYWAPKVVTVEEGRIMMAAFNILSLPKGEKIEPQAAMKENAAKIAQEVLGESLFNQSAKELLRFHEIKECRRYEFYRIYSLRGLKIVTDPQYEFYTAYRLSGHRIIIRAQINTTRGDINLMIFCAKEGAEKASDAMLPERVADATYHETEFLIIRPGKHGPRKVVPTITIEEALVREIGIHLRGIFIKLTRPIP